MITQLLLLVSTVSLVVSYFSLYPSSSSSLVYSPIYKFHHNFSANYFSPFLSHIALDKNCLFLICTGLLVFLTKTSALVCPPCDLINDILQKRIGDGQQMLTDQTTLPEEINQPKEGEKKLEDHESNFRTERPSHEVSTMILESQEEGSGENDEMSDERRTCWAFDDGDDDGERLHGQEVEVEEKEEEEEEEEEEKEKLSTEEWNQKFEDFIRMVKEEIMFNNALQKLILLK